MLDGAWKATKQRPQMVESPRWVLIIMQLWPLSNCLHSKHSDFHTAGVQSDRHQAWSRVARMYLIYKLTWWDTRTPWYKRQTIRLWLYQSRKDYVRPMRLANHIKTGFESNWPTCPKHLCWSLGWCLPWSILWSCHLIQWHPLLLMHLLQNSRCCKGRSHQQMVFMITIHSLSSHCERSRLSSERADTAPSMNVMCKLLHLSNYCKIAYVTLVDSN